jgi:iron complex transport system ATP-binding protein
MAIHDLTYAYRISDKILMLNRGKVYAAGKPEEVLTAKNISEVYGVEPLIFRDYRLIVPLLHV